MRALKPWVLFLFRLLGWYVLFTIGQKPHLKTIR